MGEMADFALDGVMDFEDRRLDFRRGEMSHSRAYELGIIDELGYEAGPGTGFRVSNPPKNKTMNNDPCIIKLNNVRLSFPSLHEKRQFKDGKPAYQASFILDPKKNAAEIKAIQAAVAHLVKEEFAGKALPPDRVCLQNNAVAMKEYDGYEGMWFIKSSNSKAKPGVVDNDLNEISAGDSADPYAGCYVNARVRLWAQNGKTVKMDATFGKRINAQLKNVQVLLRGGKPYGEPFGEGPQDPVEGFERVEENVDSGV